MQTWRRPMHGDAVVTWLPKRRLGSSTTQVSSTRRSPSKSEIVCTSASSAAAMRSRRYPACISGPVARCTHGKRNSKLPDKSMPTRSLAPCWSWMARVCGSSDEVLRTACSWRKAKIPAPRGGFPERFPSPAMSFGNSGQPSVTCLAFDANCNSVPLRWQCSCISDVFGVRKRIADEICRQSQAAGLRSEASPPLPRLSSPQSASPGEPRPLCQRPIFPKKADNVAARKLEINTT
mmetsp:Transcript_111275/g.314084  ORF Transcript_111275/g.314084 Transcript_111275/m.314084 type:complete len:235 (+) Transcript_111275:990-1694(+)